MESIYRFNLWILIIIILSISGCHKDEIQTENGLLSGIVGYWRLDDLSGDALAAVGGHDGINYAVNQGFTGKVGTAYYFSKSNNSYIDCGEVSLGINTFSFWAKRSVRGGWDCLIGLGENSFGLWIDPSNHICLVNNSGVQIATWNEWTDLSLYHHIVLVTSAKGESGKVELFVDGISKGKRSCDLPAITNFVIGGGRNIDGFTSSTSFNGLIDEVGLWSRDLTLSEVVELYNQSKGNTYSFKLGLTQPDVWFSPMLDVATLLHSLGNKIVILGSQGAQKYVRYSSDNGVTYNNGVNVTTGFVPLKARILVNGNIVLFGINEIYYSDDNLETIKPCIVLDKDGSQYLPHTPVNSDYPGAYFYFMGGFIEHDGISVLGNYTNTTRGASPVNLYYSIDGITWKVFYTFGQNKIATDDGTPSGGVGGTLLGDPNNPLTARHIHAVNIGGDGNFYVSTGDAFEEMHILKCSYNKASDSWVVNDLLKGKSVTWQRMRALGAFERGGYLYWGSDGDGRFRYGDKFYEGLGIYKCAVTDINDLTKHILLQPLPAACYSFVNIDNIVLAGLMNVGYVYVSLDYGETWSVYAKPDWMTGNVDGVWYNELHRFFVTRAGYTISGERF
ncbi:MAG TPA: LamG domain-containing protein [Bacteroidales bacterium]|jgi:hypothetical protein|nr:LamG domain-containing protein [Bacteroidales bacterium]HQJ82075.1 LamG domain-containing protein [Bacteroidales bacterium]